MHSGPGSGGAEAGVRVKEEEEKRKRRTRYAPEQFLIFSLTTIGWRHSCKGQQVIHRMFPDLSPLPHTLTLS